MDEGPIEMREDVVAAASEEYFSSSKFEGSSGVYDKVTSGTRMVIAAGPFTRGQMWRQWQRQQRDLLH